MVYLFKFIFLGALLTEDVDEINKVLAELKTEEAEKLLKICDENGILKFERADTQQNEGEGEEGEEGETKAIGKS